MKSGPAHSGTPATSTMAAPGQGQKHRFGWAVVLRLALALELRQTEKLVLLQLIARARPAMPGICSARLRVSPKRAELATAAGVSHARVSNALQELERLQIVKRMWARRGTSKPFRVYELAGTVADALAHGLLDDAAEFTQCAATGTPEERGVQDSRCAGSGTPEEKAQSGTVPPAAPHRAGSGTVPLPVAAPQKLTLKKGIEVGRAARPGHKGRRLPEGRTGAVVEARPATAGQIGAALRQVPKPMPKPMGPRETAARKRELLQQLADTLRKEQRTGKRTKATARRLRRS